MVNSKILIWGLMGIWLISAVFLVFIGGCIPPEGGEEGGSPWTMIIFIAFIIGVMYFLLIRPQRRRQKEHEDLMTELRKGDKVITAGGIYGEIESLSEDSVILRIESGATMRVARKSIATKRSR